VISRALHLNIFDQPVKNHFFNNLIDKRETDLPAILMSNERWWLQLDLIMKVC